MAAASAATNRELDDAQPMPKHGRMRMLAAADFVETTPPVPLAADEIHLWLHADEAGVGAIAVVRELLARYLGIESAALTIARDDHGKPHLASVHGADLQFNLSHSADHSIIVLARSMPLGIDIEGNPRSRPWLDLAQRYFTPAEYAALAVIPAESLRAAFLDLWSCKEAVLKALGRGIAFGLDRLSFDRDADGRVVKLVRIAVEAGQPEDWQVVRLAPTMALTGALAWRGPERILRAFLCPRGICRT